MSPLLHPCASAQGQCEGNACSDIQSGKAFREELSSPISRHQEMGTDSELFDRDQTRSEVCGFDTFHPAAYCYVKVSFKAVYSLRLALDDGSSDYTSTDELEMQK